MTTAVHSDRFQDVTTPTTSRARGSGKSRKSQASAATPDGRFKWRRIAYDALVSRALDDVEETTNKNRTSVPREHLVLYQFSARGHDVAQVILGSLIDHKHDAVSAYYRSRPVLLALGLGTRVVAAVLFVYNIVAVVSYPALWPNGLWAGLIGGDFNDHKAWGLMLLALVALGAGRISLDTVVSRRFR